VCAHSYKAQLYHGLGSSNNTYWYVKLCVFVEKKVYSIQQYLSIQSDGMNDEPDCPRHHLICTVDVLHQKDANGTCILTHKHTPAIIHLYQFYISLEEVCIHQCLVQVISETMPTPAHSTKPKCNSRKWCKSFGTDMVTAFFVLHLNNPFNHCVNPMLQ